MPLYKSVWTPRFTSSHLNNLWWNMQLGKADGRLDKIALLWFPRNYFKHQWFLQVKSECVTRNCFYHQIPALTHTENKTVSRERDLFLQYGAVVGEVRHGWGCKIYVLNILNSSSFICLKHDSCSRSISCRFKMKTLTFSQYYLNVITANLRRNFKNINQQQF